MKIAGLRLSALIEGIVLLGILLACSYLFGNGDRFIHVSPHPFWIVVLLISVQYGSLAGISMAFLATFALYVGNMPPQDFKETLFDYQLHLAATPFMWLVAAFVLGEMRLRVEGQKNKLQRQLNDLTEQADTVHAAFLTLKATKEYQDRQLASQRKTVVSIYHTFRYLESLSPSQILMDLDKIFKMALSPKKFSVYAIGPNGLEAATSHGWDTSDAYLRRITSDMPLFQAIAIDRRIVSMVDPHDEQILAKQGILAGPLYDPESNQLLGMVKIEDVDFLEFNMNTLEVFKALCETIGLAYAHARRFRLLQRQAIYSDVSGVYSEIYLKEQRQYLERLAHTYQEPLSAISIQATESYADSSVEKTLALLIASIVSPIGQVCKAGREQMHFMVLLPKTDGEQANILASKILSAVEQDDTLTDLRITQKVEVLAQTFPQSDIART